jgi:hypothetical protein
VGFDSQNKKGKGVDVAIYRGGSWVSAFEDAKIVLCPRGMGRSMFSMFSVIQLGITPLYVWDGA